MRYEITYVQSVPKKKSPLGPIVAILFIIFVIAVANDDAKKNQSSQSKPVVNPLQLPVVATDDSGVQEPATPPLTPAVTMPKGVKEPVAQSSTPSVKTSKEVKERATPPSTPSVKTSKEAKPSVVRYDHYFIH